MSSSLEHALKRFGAETANLERPARASARSYDRDHPAEQVLGALGMSARDGQGHTRAKERPCVLGSERSDLIGVDVLAAREEIERGSRSLLLAGATVSLGKRRGPARSKLDSEKQSLVLRKRAERGE